MKTPRELLLAKHQAADPKLDELRREVVGQFSAVAARTPHPALSPHPMRGEGGRRTGEGWRAVPDRLERLLVKGWQELFVPCRKVWYGLAGVWVVILLLNIAASPETGRPPRVARQEVQQFAESLLERKRMQVELLGLNGTEAPYIPPATRPRSERGLTACMC